MGEAGSRVKRLACFLGADDEKLWEAVTGLLLRPDVFVAFVLTGILKQQWKGCEEDLRSTSEQQWKGSEGDLRSTSELAPYVGISVFLF